MTERQPMHCFAELPPGKRVQDVLPQFTGVKHETPPLGTPCTCCASCRKPFTAARRPRCVLRIIPIASPIPIIFIYRLCGACAHKFHLGSEQKEAVLAAVQQFIEGKTTQ